MTATLKEAIAAVRAGDIEDAQLLVADIIESNPDDPQAWYLMSQIVDSPARRAAYLHKTLELDPSHERARAEFSRLPPELTAQLAGVGALATAEAVSPAEPAAEAVAPPPPEWLRPLGAEAVSPLPAATTPPVAPAPPDGKPVPASPVPAQPTTSGGRKDSWLIALWVILGLLTLVVLSLLIYLIIR